MKSLIISDLHAGHRSSRVERYAAVLPRLAARFDQIVIAGDTVRYSGSPVSLASAEPHLRRVRELLQGPNGGPLLVSGNHDPCISTQHFLYFQEAQLLVLHGDTLGPHRVPDVWREREFSKRLHSTCSSLPAPPGFEEQILLFRRLQAEYQRELDDRPNIPDWEYMLYQAWPPTRVWHLLRYLHSAPRAVAEMARRFSQPLRYVVFGHTHRAGRWQFGALTVYNTGSFMPLSRPYAVSVDGGQVRFGRLEEML